MIQYFSPYVSADLHKMAASFNCSVSSLEDELTQLILDEQISARIDSRKKVRMLILSRIVSIFFYQIRLMYSLTPGVPEHFLETLSNLPEFQKSKN